MQTPELPEQVPEFVGPGGGFPIQPTEAEGPLPPPRPVKTPLWLKALNVTCVAGAVAGGLFILTMASTSRTCGATRSYRLKCGERQQEIAAALQEDAQKPAIESEAPH